MNRTRTALIAVQKLSTGIGNNCGKKNFIRSKQSISVDVSGIVSGNAERLFCIKTVDN